ncbi:aldo/keto reductase [Candidatus Roizmanbacteria bacterium CG11_big_fil_rev_8_21_14_0_20_36_8]|uniref:Aldo/keto reductase n=1 Tax=Candidatus Roizmanbacteria bacterium CG11_big_fil_rev_8_21_14_0_20_36_8 TaxID=1974856 RepID=A0A2M6ITP8_9BACT|nr:MAG: aldo/keto reductase [Candidatus Roizmanbacteria bacterium CG11_big_fil_rev_8_21_14_0_20_36_8]
MKYRLLGKTGFKVSEIGYGSWAIGSEWGDVTEEQAHAALACLPEAGINFIDTADVYGDGRSEKLIGEYLSKTKTRTFVATKIGRRLSPHIVDNYSKDNLFSFVDRSCKNLNTQCLDLLQLHTPPTEIYYKPEVFSYLDELVKRKKIKFYGVSVEKVEEGLKAIEYPNVSTVQIIFNMFRQRPMELFFNEAKKRNIGVIVRVPLASGLLTGKFNLFSRFPNNDHRKYNRNGEKFDVGETFAGINYKIGLKAVEKLKKIKPKEISMAQFALRWILMQKGVSTVIAGGKTPKQILENSLASNCKTINPIIMDSVTDVYNQYAKEQVHFRW